MDFQSSGFKRKATDFIADPQLHFQLDSTSDLCEVKANWPSSLVSHLSSSLGDKVSVSVILVLFVLRPGHTGLGSNGAYPEVWKPQCENYSFARKEFWMSTHPEVFVLFVRLSFFFFLDYPFWWMIFSNKREEYFLIFILLCYFH